MNSNVVISIDTRRPKKDKTCPVILRLSHNGKTIAIRTGYFVTPKDWDDKNRCFKKSYRGALSVARLNNSIAKKRAEVIDVLTKLDDQGELAYLSVKDIKDRIVKKSDGGDATFFSYGSELVEEMNEAKRYGNARSYKGVISILRSFRNGKDLPFQEITYSMLIQFETWHLAKGNSINSLGVYMRSLRAIYNKGVKAGVVPKELPYPFAEYKIKTKPTAKRAISYESVKKIMDLELSESHPCFHERNIFVASFLAYGMNYADLAMLKLSHVADGRLTYHRQKTGKIYDIKITPQLDEILSYYMKGKTTDDFIFPIVKRDSSELQYRDVMWARRRYNVKLKEIGKLAGLDTPLTSYVARHTFASLANHQGIPVSAISHMLGHSDLKTTQVYLESLSSKALDEYNLVITGQNQ